MTTRLLRAAVGLGALLVGAGLATAAPVTFTSRSAFDAALAGFTTHVVDFEGLGAGDTLADGSVIDDVGLSFVRSAASTGLDLVIGNQYVTTSGSNFLGVDDGFSEQFFNDDGLSLAFATPVNAIGLFVITPGGGAFAGDFTLAAAGTSVSNPLLPDQTLPTGDLLVPEDDAYFLGIIDPDAAFASALLSSLDPALGFVSFNVDDIVTASRGGDEPGGSVPAPGVLSLVAPGLAALLSRRRRERRRRASLPQDTLEKLP
ncbi:MAG: hypothetical protein KDH20_13905 [Rhodocyclaceae bacterium]|nr:hypothetical protein [Rhodocyclaceae bacterium]